MPAGETETRIYPELLKSGRTISIVPDGKSMFPLLDGKSDSVIISPLGVPIRKDDLVLYTDKEGRLVVHRVWKADKTGYVLLGDGNIEKEFPIDEKSIYGVCVAIKRNGKNISTTSAGYRIYTLIWRMLYPIRRYILKLLLL